MNSPMVKVYYCSRCHQMKRVTDGLDFSNHRCIHPMIRAMIPMALGFGFVMVVRLILALTA